ncbi:hypothetical protein [Anabaena azotica]|uniref:CpcB n=1 Tax=Anabaena azotica FACHB-119 TaxID=947527 RepID=A0ABR8D342_9NOST|nr:hypothetical protein [Anabaena azotica]MBD2501346.1 hypothetical protein [Anabaena azotica FACHB-119]
MKFTYIDSVNAIANSAATILGETIVDGTANAQAARPMVEKLLSRLVWRW